MLPNCDLSVERVGAVIAMWLALAGGAAAQTRSITIAGPSSAPTLDGLLDDAAWLESPYVDTFVQVAPAMGEPESVATELRLMHDGQTLFIAVRAKEEEGSGITARQMRRDSDFSGDDHMSIVLDPTAAGRTGYVFRINPNGAQADGLIFNGDEEREDWDAIWDARTVLAPDGGWTAELAIPLGVMSASGVSSSWGFNVERYRAATGERVRWNGVLADREVSSLPDAGTLGGMPAAVSGDRLRLKPGIRLESSDEDGHSEHELEPALDVFWRLRDDTTATLTLNADFAESEVDDRQVNLTRFKLFLPEKREFFLQDAGLFSFGGLSQDVLPFFSRRIGLTDEGAPLTLDAGLKLTHESAKLQAGVLAVDVEAPPGGEPEQIGAARVATDLGLSQLGFIGTVGDPSGLSGSSLVGFDYRYQNPAIVGDKTLIVDAWTQSTESDARDRGAAHGVALRWPNLGWTGDVFARRIEEDYEPALGFVREVGISAVGGELGYWWRTQSGGDVIAKLGGQDQAGLEDARTYREADAQIFVGNALEDSIHAAVYVEHEELIEDFQILPDLLISAGEYSGEFATMEVNLSPARPLSGLISLRAGDFYGGSRQDYSLEGNWQPTRQLGVSLGGTRTDLDLPGGKAQVHEAALRLDLTPSTRIFGSLTAQWDDVTEEVAVALRFRWTLKPGRDLYISVDHLFDRETGFDTGNRAATLKFNWNWFL